MTDATTLSCSAPAKINLALYVGEVREEDGRHELVTVFQPVDLVDHLTARLDERLAGDEVRCPGVDGPNLAATALAAYRAETGWDGPPIAIDIEKRIPIAGGMAGGSADAAAARCASLPRSPAMTTSRAWSASRSRSAPTCRARSRGDG